jgi:hypothetical protein
LDVKPNWFDKNRAQIERGEYNLKRKQAKAFHKKIHDRNVLRKKRHLSQDLKKKQSDWEYLHVPSEPGRRPSLLPSGEVDLPSMSSGGDSQLDGSVDLNVGCVVLVNYAALLDLREKLNVTSLLNRLYLDHHSKWTNAQHVCFVANEVKLFAGVDEDIVDVSVDHVLYLCRPGTDWMRARAVDVMKFTQDALVVQSFLSVLPKLVDKKGFKTIDAQVSIVKQHMIRFYHRNVEMERHVRSFLGSQWARDELSRSFDPDMMLLRRQNEVEVRLAMDGITPDGIRESIIQKFRAKLCAYYSRLCCLFPCVKKPTIRDCRLEVVNAAHEQLFRVERLNFVPCSTMYMNKVIADVEEQKLFDSAYVKLSSDYEGYDGPVVTDEHVDIYGTTMPLAAVYPSNHPQNVEVALRKRMLFDRGFDPTLLREFEHFGRKFIDDMPEVHLDPGFDVLSHLQSTYGVKKGDRLMNLRGNLRDKDAWSELFVKGELYLDKTPDDFKPRMIWNRSENVIAEFSHVFKQIGNDLKKTFNGRSPNFYACSTTPDLVGKYVEHIMESPFVVKGDVSNWDGSMLKTMLDLELYYLDKKIFNKPENFQWLVENWHKVRGTVLDYITVTMRHARRSGDLWTSPFNSLLNILVIRFCAELKPSDSVMVLGDDDLFGAESVDVDRCRARYAGLGLKVDMSICENLQDVEFCSGIFLPVDGHLRYSNKPMRTLRKFGINHNKHDPKIFKRLLYGTAKSMLPTAGHVPVIGAIFRAITRDSIRLGIKEFHDEKHRNPYRIQGGPVCTPGDDTYAEYSKFSGVDATTLRMIDDWLEDNITLDTFPAFVDDDILLRMAMIESNMDDYVTNVTLDYVLRPDEVYSVVMSPVEEEMENWLSQVVLFHL